MFFVALIGFVLIVFALAILYYIFHIKNENKLNRFDQSKERLEKMSDELELLSYLAKENAKVFERVENLKNQILFENPSENKQVEEYDNRIKSQISDLKIALARAKDKGTFSSVNRIISQIEVLLIERRQKEK